MADLLARYDNLESSAQSIWRYSLPELKEVAIGRRPLTDMGIPEWNRSDWVVEDPRISGRHVVIRWDGKALTVRRRMVPADRPATNPVFYKGKPNDDFSIAAGESFTIGSTTFLIQEPEVDPNPDSCHPDLMTMTIGRDELRRSAFIDAKTPLMALADLPDLIRNCHDESELEERVLGVIMKGLPLAEFAGFVVLDPRGGREARAAITRSKQGRISEDQFVVSHRLVRHAMLVTLESVMHIWDRKVEEAEFSATMTPGTDWAICTPLGGENSQGRALYVAGSIPRHFTSEEQFRSDPEFQDYQKFVNLASELLSSMNELRRYQSHYEQLRRYLPKRMVALLASQNLDEKLRPRIAQVTALFCDLRGSSLYAQESGDMLGSWKRMSAALDIMTGAIDEYEGVIGGLQGDAAVGFWGWPTETDDQIDRAVRAALRIRKEFNRNRELNISQFNCGIGLAHGAAVVGRLGVYDQFKLDAYGPVMNLAARLESLTKRFGVQILVDSAIATHLTKSDPDSNRVRIRRLAKVCPAGMNISMEISELMPPLVDADPDEGSVNYLQWEAGASAFIEGRWPNARRLLQRFMDQLPKSRTAAGMAAQLLLQHIERFNGTPPDDWNGTIVMDAK